jgi:hypothetical protein
MSLAPKERSHRCARPWLWSTDTSCGDPTHPKMRAVSAPFHQRPRLGGPKIQNTSLTPYAYRMPQSVVRPTVD